MKTLLMILVFLISTSAFAKDFYFVKINGIISGFTYKYLQKALETAEKNDGVLVIKLDTPGGLLTSTRKIVQMQLESKTPTITFVSPQGSRAGSAGTFILLAGNLAVMSEGSNVGAAHPVNITGKNIDGDMRKKIENDTSAFIRSIAEKRGRNQDIAVDTVMNSASLTAKEALEKGIIDFIVNTDDELVKLSADKLGIKAGTKKYLEPTALQRVAFFLSDPNILMLLLFIGILAIALEFKMPGTFVFAGTGTIAIVLFLMGINIIPVNMLALILILAGIAMLVAEIFVPSFGLLTLGSLSCMIGGMYLLFSKTGNLGIKVSPVLITATASIIIAVVLTIGRLIMKDFKRRPVTGHEGLIGNTGKIMEWNKDKGKIYVHGEIWSAESDKEFNKDDKVKVTGINGIKLRVDKI